LRVSQLGIWQRTCQIRSVSIR